MLLEFRVRNYKSIRDEQVLSLVASGGHKEPIDPRIAPTGLKSLPWAVRSAVICGPNASGKSSLLLALAYMRAVVAESASTMQPGQTYSVQPFRLDEASAKGPTEFEMTFVIDGVRHQYAFAMTAERIVSESLVVYRTSKPSRWFSRALADDGETYDYEFSVYLTGPRRLWQDSTRPNALFLSTAAQLNSDLLSPIFQWIVKSVAYLPAGAPLPPDFTTAMLSTREGRDSIREFLSAADISIADVQAVPLKESRGQAQLHAGGVTHAVREKAEVLVPIFEHATPKGRAKFELQEESEGTQRLYSLVAPLLSVLKDGRILVVDELDSSLHTLLVRRLISMFHDPALNKSGAQLVFSTHDASLLDHALFLRDQIWFTEKDGSQATQLYPLTDFSPRSREAWQRNYLTGRYGAVPYLGASPHVLAHAMERAPKAAPRSTPSAAA